MKPPRNIRKLGDAHCQCAGCGEYFNSDKAFEWHRVGPYSARRCLTVEEMRALGMVLKLDKRGDGWWVTELREGPVEAAPAPQDATEDAG
jgi:hypothetical protein